MKSKGEQVNWDNSDNLDNSDRYTLTDARRLWMTWWNRNAPDLLNLRAKHHAEGQRAFQSLIAEAHQQLRTDETVERLANFLHEDDRQETLDEHEAWCHAPECEARLSYNKYARAAITALIGDTP